MAELNHSVEQVLLDGLGLGVISLDRELRITRWNEWISLQMQIASQDALGHPLVELFPSVAENGLLQRLNQTLQHGMTQLLSPLFHHHLLPIAISRKADRTEYMIQSIKILPIKDEHDIVGLLLLVEDYTERTTFEKALRKSNDELTAERLQLQTMHEDLKAAQREVVEAEHLKALVETAGATAHEISQPLQALQTSQEILLYEPDAETNPWRPALTKSLQHIESIVQIIRKMQSIQQYRTKPYLRGRNIVDFESASTEKNRSADT